MIQYTHNEKERLYTASPIYKETTLPSGIVIKEIMFIATLPKKHGDSLSKTIVDLLNKHFYDAEIKHQSTQS